jgi:hypothetical protein
MWRLASPPLAATFATLATLAAAAPPPHTAAPRAAAVQPIFSERAAELGVDFVHVNGMSGKTYMVEIMGPGIALLDYDNDGDLDIYVVQGGPLPPAAGKPGRALTDRLFRNDLAETGKLHFTDVTEAAGIAALGPMDYGQGVATGDVNNDGWVDIYRTGFGHNRLLLNTGKGTFVDATAKAQVTQADPRWSTSATFFDYDRDGRLDLFVANYVDLSLAAAASHPCRSDAGFVDYCGPLSYKPLPSMLFHNRGDGTFEDVSRRAGIAAEPSNGLGVVALDLNGDGWPDLYVADDGVPNHLWINQRNGTFADQAVEAGCAVNGEGNPTASMGLAAADFDGDGHDDIFVTNLSGETDTLFLGDGRGNFTDGTLAAGLAAPSLPFTSFGTYDLDYDNDGWPDLLVVNGAIHKIPEQVKAGDPLPLRQRAQLFHNLGRGRFAEITGPALGPLASERIRRGAAFGDLDNDGDTDVVAADNDGRLEVFLNNVGQKNRWLGLRLTGGTPPRDMLGARVEAALADGRVLVRHVHTDGSYLSANDPRVLLGLGPAGSVREVRVTWPDGRRERFAGPPAGRYTTLRQGGGAPLATAGETPK